ncbi:hypothetical protein KY346_06220 [Candidatus Woesearchaeota archaeon]|nr:hypothetical protein [Candidatus Woesearchaeota archaeon]
MKATLQDVYDMMAKARANAREFAEAGNVDETAREVQIMERHFDVIKISAGDLDSLLDLMPERIVNDASNPNSILAKAHLVAAEKEYGLGRKESARKLFDPINTVSDAAFPYTQFADPALKERALRLHRILYL